MYVHSWIFRNRARLRLIYGTPTPAVSLPSDEVRPEHLPMGVEARVEGPLPPPQRSRNGTGTRTGRDPHAHAPTSQLGPQQGFTPSTGGVRRLPWGSEDCLEAS
jgi:hypothetical protein